MKSYPFSPESLHFSVRGSTCWSLKGYGLQSLVLRLSIVSDLFSGLVRLTFRVVVSFFTEGWSLQGFFYQNERDLPRSSPISRCRQGSGGYTLPPVVVPISSLPDVKSLIVGSSRRLNVWVLGLHLPVSRGVRGGYSRTGFGTSVSL